MAQSSVQVPKYPHARKQVGRQEDDKGSDNLIHDGFILVTTKQSESGELVLVISHQVYQPLQNCLLDSRDAPHAVRRHKEKARLIRLVRWY